MTREIPARRLLSALGLALLWGHASFGREVFFKPAPTTVSGTLSPFLLEVGGSTLRKSASAVTEIQVNGVTLNPRDGKGRPFFGLIDTDVIEIKARQGFADYLPIPPVVLPKIEGITVGPSGIHCRTSGGVAVVVWEEKRYDVKAGEAEIPIPAGDPFLELIYPIELVGSDASPSRLYSVRFGKNVPDPMFSSNQSSQPIRPLSLLNFYVGSNLVFQDRDGSRGQTGEVAWTPRLPLSARFFSQAWVGASIHKRVRGGRFFCLDLGASAGAYLSPRWLVTLGGDSYTWSGYGGTRFGPSASLSFRFSLGFVEGLLASYGFFREDALLVHVVRLGVGLKW